MLSNYDGSVIDSISYGVQTPDTSYGRLPNADGPFQILFPTFSAENSALSVSNIENENTFILFPNPAQENLQIIISNNRNINDITILDLTGKQIKNISVNNTSNININVSDLQKGIYFVRIGHSVQKFVKN